MTSPKLYVSRKVIQAMLFLCIVGDESEDHFRNSCDGPVENSTDSD